MYLLWTNSTHLADKHLTSKLTIICYIKIKKPIVRKKYYKQLAFKDILKN